MCDNNNKNVKEYFDYVLSLVLEAGKIVQEAKDVKVERKEEVWDLVTQYDYKVEEILIRKLKEKFPSHKFIGEEESTMSGQISELTDDPTWIIDPIDGTANFVRKMPIFGISVGLTINKKLVAGVVHNPFLNETFTAIKGQGAYRNGIRIHTRNITEVARSNLNYELSLARSDLLKPMYMSRLNHLISIMEGIRAYGCASLGLCYVACGYNDAYQCDGLMPWDAAAGVVIVREAGGYVCDSSEKNLGKEFDLMNPNFLAAASRELAEKYVEIERRADQERLAKT